jgi:dipeptidyl aminopeptidase/acylaminoacyl peptidase
MMGACTQSASQPVVKEPVKPAPVVENATLPPSVNMQPGGSIGIQDDVTKPVYQEKIVFWSLRDAKWNWNWSMNWNQLEDRNYEIYIMDPDGKNQVRLTDNSNQDWIPSISPDGTKILFVSDRKWEADNKFDDNYNIYVMDIDGRNVKNLTGSKSWASMPSWSPVEVW